MLKYSVAVKWSDEDEGFIAFVPELPGLSAFGNTSQEAVAEIQIAEEAYLESLREAGEALPAPEKFVAYSGQIRLRMPKSLHAKLTQSASEENVSLNTYLVSLLSEARTEKETAKLYRSIIFSAIRNQPPVDYQASEAKGDLITNWPTSFDPFILVPSVRDATNKELRSVHNV